MSRRKSRIAADLEQRLTQLFHGPPEVQRAAQVRLELRVVHSGCGEHRHHHQAAIFQLQTGPIPQSTPDVFDGGLEERRQKRIAWCRRLTKHALTDRCAARLNVPTTTWTDPPELTRLAFNESFTRLLAPLEPVTDEELFAADRWPWLGGEALVETILWDSSRHYDAHREHLERLSR